MSESTSPLIEQLKSFARMLVSDQDVGGLLHRICEVAVEALAVDGAGILLRDTDGSLRYAVASDERTAQIEGLQLETGEGPCMLAHREGRKVVVGELASETRFPVFTARAMDAGIRAVFTFPLCHGEESFGVLDLYQLHTGTLTEAQQDDAQLLADMAATAVLNRRAHDEGVELTDRLQSALDERIVIEQAKGRVSEQMGVPEDVAEKLLYERARTHGETPNAVARRIGTGELRLDALQDEAG